jgi:hypothetical protein
MGIAVMAECEHCQDGWVKDERIEDCGGGGPSEHFHYVSYKDPCLHCNQADQADEQPDEYYNGPNDLQLAF